MGISTDFAKTRIQLEGMERKLSPAINFGLASWLAGPAHQYLQHRADRTFEENQDGGGIWPPLKEATGNWRVAKGYSRYTPINQRTGQMRSVLTDGAPDLGTDGMGVFLNWPGTRARSGRMLTKLRQAQGMLPRKGGYSTPRPVIFFEMEDVMALMVSFQKFIGGEK